MGSHVVVYTNCPVQTKESCAASGVSQWLDDSCCPVSSEPKGRAANRIKRIPRFQTAKGRDSIVNGSEYSIAACQVVEHSTSQIVDLSESEGDASVARDYSLNSCFDEIAGNED